MSNKTQNMSGNIDDRKSSQQGSMIKRDAFVAVIQSQGDIDPIEKLLPKIEVQPGFIGSLHVDDPRNQRMTTNLIWESKEALDNFKRSSEYANLLEESGSTMDTLNGKFRSRSQSR